MTQANTITIGVVFAGCILTLSACTAQTLTYNFVSVDKAKVIKTLEENKQRVDSVDLSQGISSLSIANRFAICTQDGVGYELTQPRYKNNQICGEDNLDIYNIDLLCFEWTEIHSVGDPYKKKIKLATKRKEIVQDACDAAFKRR